MLISGSQMVTTAVSMGRDGLPGGVNAGSVGIKGMPTKKHRDTLPSSVVLKMRPIYTS